MDAQKNVARRRTGEEIRQIMAEFASGGMPASEFCHRHGISRSTIHRYLRKQREQNQGNGAHGQFLAVELRPARANSPANSGGLTVGLANGQKIEVGRGFDGSTLERLLNILERR
jgi:transposase-like protein